MSSAAAISNALPDGWQRHDGWEYRGEADDLVELRFRNGLTPHVDPSRAGNWRWERWQGGPHDFDIVEYRKVGA